MEVKKDPKRDPQGGTAQVSFFCARKARTGNRGSAPKWTQDGTPSGTQMGPQMDPQMEPRWDPQMDFQPPAKSLLGYFAGIILMVANGAQMEPTGGYCAGVLFDAVAGRPQLVTRGQLKSAGSQLE